MQNANIFDQATPIVEEKDFPEKSSEFQLLMNRYKSEQHLPVEMPQPTSQSNPLGKVKVSNEVTTRAFNQLKEEDRKKVLERIEGIDYMSSVAIQTFGTAKGSSMTKHAEIIISKYSASNVGEHSDPIARLISILKANSQNPIVKNPNVDDSRELGIFATLREMRAIKSTRKKISKALAERESILMNIKAVEVELLKQQISLRRDITVYENMGKASTEQVSDFELDCIALQVMIDDAQSKLDAITSKGEANMMELNDANNLQWAIERMSRRFNTIQTMRIATFQTISQIELLIKGDEIICEKIDEINTLVIPMWEWQYAVAIGTMRQKEALSAIKTIRSITSKLITGNAKMLHDNMIAAQKDLCVAVVAIQDLITVQNYVDDMISKVNEVCKETPRKCIEQITLMVNK